MTVKDKGTNDFPSEYKPTRYKLKFFPAFLAVLIVSKHLFLLYLDKTKIKKIKKTLPNFDSKSWIKIRYGHTQNRLNSL